jgi:hypothetical protein
VYCRQEDELRVMAEELAIVRRARLQDLYRADFERYPLIFPVGLAENGYA